MHKSEFEKGIKHLCKHDKILRDIIKNYGIRNLRSHRKYFNLLLNTIISQQLSTKAADAIQKRFMDFFSNNPQPELVLAADNSVLRGLGLSNAKVTYVKDLSQKVISKELKLAGISILTDDEVIAELTKVKGIGVWSAQMFLMFTLGRPNILPTGDLGIRKAVMLNYNLKKLPTEQRIEEAAKKNKWHPFCTIACLYMWRSLDGK
ncbi:MAG: DNA-3-methyladenine glycosylase 2 family protein [Bacteroidota bacterium]